MDLFSMSKDELSANLIGAKESLKNLKNRVDYDESKLKYKNEILKERVKLLENRISELSGEPVKSKKYNKLKYVLVGLLFGAAAIAAAHIMNLI